MGKVYNNSSGSINITNCYSTGDVSASSFSTKVAAIAGSAVNGSIKITGCYYLSSITVTGATIATNGTKLTDAQMRDSSSFAGWDFDTVWEIGKINGYAYPTLCSVDTKAH